MAENLDFAWSGLPVGSAGNPATPAAWYYDDNQSTWGWDGRKCGLLYNQYAVQELESNKATLIPGWHVPTRAEYSALKTAVGSSISSKDLKSLDKSWFSNWYGTDKYGFSMMPCGRRNQDGGALYYAAAVSGWLWTPDARNGGSYYTITFGNNDEYSTDYYDGPSAGHSLRLVKD